MSYFPVALFAYNRPEHLERTLQALAQADLADQTALYIFSDGPKSHDDVGVKAVRKLIAAYEGFLSVTVVEASENLGLAGSVIAGVSKLLKSYEAVIVLEDDVICSPQFLTYMNAALKRYRDKKSIFSVTGHMFPRRSFPLPDDYEFDTFLAPRCSSWSWGVWRDRWNKVDWEMRYFKIFSQDLSLQDSFSRGGEDLLLTLKKQHKGEINSWAIRFCYAHFSNNAYCVYPAKTLVKNIGLDHSGTHSIPDRRYAHGDLDPNWLPAKFCPENYLNEYIQNQFQIFFKIQKSLYASIKSNLMRMAQYFFLQKKYLSSSVLFVNTYERMGGAAIAANRLFQSISAKIEGVRLLTLIKQSQDENVDGISRYSLRGKCSEVYLNLRNLIYLTYPKKQKSFFSINGYSNLFRLTRWRLTPKIVHLHWIGDGILSVAELKKWNCPIVWTLHDAWAFTGGCHYTQGCIRYLNQCGNCPQLGSNVSNDISQKFFIDKERAYATLNLTIVTPSNWLAQMAKSSALLKNVSIRVIPNGIDMSVFLPKNKKQARETLGIHHDLPIILIGAQSLKDQRKGVDLFVKSLGHIRFPCAILVFGSGDLTLLRDTGFMVHSLGEIDNEAVMVNVYSAANVFVCPSREDNLPNTIIESMSCGTPAVAFGVGGIPEIIDHLRVGWLATPFDVAELAKGVEWVIGHPEYADLCKKTHQYALAKFNLDKTTKAYLDLYDQLLMPQL